MYKRQAEHRGERVPIFVRVVQDDGAQDDVDNGTDDREHMRGAGGNLKACLLYTS